jgi:hypothetical protein
MSVLFVYHTLASRKHSYAVCLADELVGWQSNKVREEGEDVLIANGSFVMPGAVYIIILGSSSWDFFVLLARRPPVFPGNTPPVFLG